MPRPLFRPEALAHQQDRLGGDVLITRAPRITLLVWLTALFALVLVSFGFWGHYTRKEHVGGYLAPTLGLIRVFTPQTGTVLERHVSEGQSVRKDEVLLVISSERATASTPQAQEAMLRELRQRRESLREEQSKQREIDGLTRKGIAERISALEEETAETEAQIKLTESQVAGAERTVARHEQLLEKRFVSDAVLQQKRDELIDRRNDLARIERSITALTRELSAARVELAASHLEAANNHAAYERQISELQQQITEADARRSAVITAPADGTVTTVLAQVGQTASPNQTLLSILPAGAELRAELLVPTRAIGFIRPSQEVALRYQAFPYQRFGHHVGHVEEVGRTAIQPGESNLPLRVEEPFYRITVGLPAQRVLAYGQALPLQAGMTLDADIRIDRRRLIDWIFDPLLSVTGRL